MIEEGQEETARERDEKGEREAECREGEKARQRNRDGDRDSGCHWKGGRYDVQTRVGSHRTAGGDRQPWSEYVRHSSCPEPTQRHDVTRVMRNVRVRRVLRANLRCRAQV